MLKSDEKPTFHDSLGQLVAWLSSILRVEVWQVWGKQCQGSVTVNDRQINGNLKASIGKAEQRTPFNHFAVNSCLTWLQHQMSEADLCWNILLKSWTRDEGKFHPALGFLHVLFPWTKRHPFCKCDSCFVLKIDGSYWLEKNACSDWTASVLLANLQQLLFSCLKFWMHTDWSMCKRMKAPGNRVSTIHARVTLKTKITLRLPS